MPLIDEQSERTDHRPRTVLPWVAVIAGLALLWVLVSLGISLAHHSARGAAPASPLAPAQEMNVQLVQQAQMLRGWGQAAEAAALLQRVNEEVPMSASDKHTYFRVAGETYAATGSPLAGSRYYERFLSMATQIHTAECRSCHEDTPSSIPPRDLAAMLTSELGAKYASTLKAAGKLQEKRDALNAQLGTEPESPRLHLFLYHLESALKEPQAAAAHAAKLRELDEQQRRQDPQE
jgi:hypothetical protein